MNDHLFTNLVLVTLENQETPVIRIRLYVMEAACKNWGKNFQEITIRFYILTFSVHIRRERYILRSTSA